MERTRLTVIVAGGKSFIWQVPVKSVDDKLEKLFLECLSDGLADGIFFRFDRNAVIGNVILKTLVGAIFLDPLSNINRRDGKASDDDSLSGQGLELLYDIMGHIKDAIDSHEVRFDEESTVLRFAKHFGHRPPDGSRSLMACQDQDEGIWGWRWWS